MSAPDGLIERDELIEALRQRGIHVTPAKLLRWHDRWLLPQPTRKGQGQGKGSRSYYPLVALSLAAFIEVGLRESRDLDGVGWNAWCVGFPLTPFARDYLLTIAEDKLKAAKKLAKLLSSGTKAATAMKRRIAREIGPLTPVLKHLSEDRFLEALSGFLDIELGVWRPRPGTDSRIQAIGTALTDGITDWLHGETATGRLDQMKPMIKALESSGIPDGVVSESVSAASSHQSLPILIDWLKNVPDRELERLRNEAMAFLQKCQVLAASDEPLSVSVDGFLRYLRIRALEPDPETFGNANIDAVLRADPEEVLRIAPPLGARKPALWERRRDFGRAIVTKKRLYLDTKFWNTFCDVQLGCGGTEEDAGALALIRKLVKECKLVCPGEYTVLHEFLGQRVDSKRIAACELVDELSGGAMILSKSERMFFEVLRFMSAATEPPPWPSAPIEEMWTKPAFIFGDETPALPGIPPDVRAWVIENAQAELWEKSFAEIVGVLAAFPDAADRGRPVTNEMNEMKQTVRKRFPSRRALYLAQIDGSLDVEDSLRHVSLYQFHAAGGDTSTVTAEQSANAAVQYKALLVSCFEKYDLALQLPTVHILAELYTRADWDLKGKFKPNDLADFSHAACALPYADCFATERSLKNQIAQTKLDMTYGTVVVSDTPSLLQWLASIV